MRKGVAKSQGRIAVVFGTRPEAIKLSGLLRLLGDEAHLIHTGQHYDAQLSDAIIGGLDIPSPATNLGIGGVSRGEQVGKTVDLLDRYFRDRPPTAVVVQGDTNATLAGALSANARALPLIHIEAGLRSFDRDMPEEHNRIVADHLADICCVPTDVNQSNLQREGITDDRIVVTGNTVVEAVHRLLPRRYLRRRMLSTMNLESERYILATFHRPENVDDHQRLSAILEGLGSLPIPVVLPIHPRTSGQIRAFGLEKLLSRIKTLSPLDYRTFLSLEAESAVIVSDSGGVQEEASILKRPVVVVRKSTERPEVVGTFATVTTPRKMSDVVSQILTDNRRILDELSQVPTPYGDLTAPEKSLQGIRVLLDA